MGTEPSTLAASCMTANPTRTQSMNRPMCITCQGIPHDLQAPVANLEYLKKLAQDVFNLIPNSYKILGSQGQEIIDDFQYMDEINQPGKVIHRITIIFDEEQEIEEDQAQFTSPEDQPPFIEPEPIDSESSKLNFEPPDHNAHELSASPESQGGPKKLSLYDLFVIEITTKHLLRINSNVCEYKQCHLLQPFGLCIDAAWAVIDGEYIFYCGGGFHEAPDNMDKAFRFVPTQFADEFNVEEMARMETKRYNHGLVHYEGFVFVLGGLDEFGVATDGFECFSFAYNEWKKLAELPKPMERPVAAALGEVVYFTDFSTRSIFTYSMVHNKMGRLPFIQLEERTGKALIIKRSGTILVLSERKLIKIKGGKIVKSKKAN